MKAKLTDEIKEIFLQGKNWLQLEVEYVKLTAAEKMIILMSTLIIGGIFMLLLLPVFIMFLFALAGVFKLFMSPPLAYLTVGGIVLAVLFIVYLFRNVLVINPVSKFISRLFLERHSHSEPKS